VADSTPPRYRGRSSAYGESRQDGFTIALLAGPPAVQRVFELTGTTDQLPFVDA
jgi:hypothetical protein